MAATRAQAKVSRQYINIRAFLWARDQELPKTEKLVLTEFAIPCSDKGYSFPSIENIAFRWGLDRETVRRARDALLVSRKLLRTKKLVGDTGQVKVYRLPKIAYESGGEFHLLNSGVSGGKAADKRGISGGGFTPNNEEVIRNKGNHNDSKPRGSSLVDGRNNARPKSSISFSGSYQNHIKWPEFAAHAKRLDKVPTADWFERWLNKQRPQWRNKKSPQQEVLEQTGYLLYGKFLTSEEATQRLIADPSIHDKLLPAVRRHGKTEAQIRRQERASEHRLGYMPREQFFKTVREVFSHATQVA
jgi:hypothetical protein